MKIFDGLGQLPSKDELRDELSDGSGVFVIRNAYTNTALLDRVERTFYGRIGRQTNQSADHFAAGSNQRVWNAVNKLATDAPEDFIEYYGNPWLHLACEAWLGPLYQLTAQVNVVVPGGQAQTGHRDYHLGFFPSDLAKQLPPAMHAASPWLTLQGAIVHCDTPVEMGPTQFVLGSQNDPDGYLTYRDESEQARFEKDATQSPLCKGDLVFFNPAIFHAAGENRTQTPRLVNLLQVSSGLAKPMEDLDFHTMVEQIHPYLGLADPALASNAVKVITDCYPFPSNLDLDPPSEDWLGQTDANWLMQRLDENTTIVARQYKERLERRQYRSE